MMTRYCIDFDSSGRLKGITEHPSGEYVLYQEAQQIIATLTERVKELEAQLHDAKTQCGKNAVSHMREYHRAQDLEAELARVKGIY